MFLHPSLLLSLTLSVFVISRVQFALVQLWVSAGIDPLEPRVTVCSHVDALRTDRLGVHVLQFSRYSSTIAILDDFGTSLLNMFANKKIIGKSWEQRRKIKGSSIVFSVIVCLFSW